MSDVTRKYEPSNLKQAVEDAGRTTLKVRMASLEYVMQRDRMGLELSSEEAAIVDHVRRAMMCLDAMSRRVMSAAASVMGKAES